MEILKWNTWQIYGKEWAPINYHNQINRDGVPLYFSPFRFHFTFRHLWPHTWCAPYFSVGFFSHCEWLHPLISMFSLFFFYFYFFFRFCKLRSESTTIDQKKIVRHWKTESGIIMMTWWFFKSNIQWNSCMLSFWI